MGSEGGAGGEEQAAARRPLEFWQALAGPQAPVPEGLSARTLARELTPLLNETDPVWRDAVASSLLARWTRRGWLGADDWQHLLPSLLALGAQPGEANVLGRSFGVSGPESW